LVIGGGGLAVVFVRAIGLMKNLKKERKSKGLARKSSKRKMGRNPRKTLPTREIQKRGRTKKCEGKEKNTEMQKHKQSQVVVIAIQ